MIKTKKKITIKAIKIWKNKYKQKRKINEEIEIFLILKITAMKIWRTLIWKTVGLKTMSK